MISLGTPCEMLHKMHNVPIKISRVALQNSPVISQDYFTNLPLPENVIERREVATKEIKK